jgi:glutamate--cysteine ligase
MDAFMLFCLLTESPRINAQERRAIDENQVLGAQRGRDPALELDRDGQSLPLRAWADELLDAMAPAAELLDGGSGGPCAASLALQREKVREPELTPSARILAEMRANGEGFFGFARRMSEQHREHFRALALSDARQSLFEALAAESRQRQAAIEAADDIPFDEFLARYFAQRESLAPA